MATLSPQPASTATPKSAEYPNFYENIKEANMRLRNTVVLYDGQPYMVRIILPHKDGIFRIYADPVGDPNHFGAHPNRFRLDEYTPDDKVVPILDKWMTDNPTCTLTRKYMSAAGFNKFRPFPLGMYHFNQSVYYLERTPTRKSEQGLTKSSIIMSKVGLANPDAPKLGGGSFVGDMMSPSFADCIRGVNPEQAFAYDTLLDESVLNDAMAFDRNMAFVKGPCNTVFLCYKRDAVAIATTARDIQLSAKFVHLREVLTESKRFDTITVR